MNQKRSARALAAAAGLACATLLAGCGGGGGSGAASPAAVQAVPDAAMQTVDAMVAFMRSLASGTSDTTEPLALTTGDLPKSDDAEPSTL